MSIFVILPANVDRVIGVLTFLILIPIFGIFFANAHDFHPGIAPTSHSTIHFDSRWFEYGFQAGEEMEEYCFCKVYTITALSQ